jgi:nucleoside phosphorylase
MAVLLDPNLYTVALFAPLEIEAQAVLWMLDKKHPGKFPMSRGMDYVFDAGEMCGYNVIIATLPSGGTQDIPGSTAALTAQVKAYFPNLLFGLLVGVATGLPNLNSPHPVRDIRLGDVLVCHPTKLVTYNVYGSDVTQRCPGLVSTKIKPVISAIDSIKLRAPNDTAAFWPHYESIKYKRHTNGTFIDPGQGQDELYEAEEYQLVRQPRPDSERARVWYGPLGSGTNLVCKRDELRDKYGVIGLDMRAVEVIRQVPIVIIRGVCDYGDGHNTTEWQPYAAAMAAAYAKAVLSETH